MNRSLKYAGRLTTLALASLTFAVPAAAQPEGGDDVPNPFEDFERGDKLSEVTVEPSGDGSGGGSRVGYRVDQGTWSVGGEFQFAYTNTSNGVLVGGDESSETLFTRFVATGKYFIVDNVEVAVSAGLYSKLLSRENSRSSRETGFLMEAAGFYHVPLGEGFGLAPGLGLGFYAGGSARDLVLPTGEVANESTSTAGFSGTLHLTGAYQPHRDWRIRSGLAISVLAGGESVGSQDTSLTSRAVHISLPLEVVYLF
ncbi:MAG: hypothetical protein AAF715_30930 [Myxococcota bacterium]